MMLYSLLSFFLLIIRPFWFLIYQARVQCFTFCFNILQNFSFLDYISSYFANNWFNFRFFSIHWDKLLIFFLSILNVYLMASVLFWVGVFKFYFFPYPWRCFKVGISNGPATWGPCVGFWNKIFISCLRF